MATRSEGRVTGEIVHSVHDETPPDEISGSWIVLTDHPFKPDVFISAVLLGLKIQCRVNRLRITNVPVRRSRCSMNERALEVSTEKVVSAKIVVINSAANTSMRVKPATELAIGATSDPL